MITDAATRNMVRPWLSENDEADAKMLRGMFRSVSSSIRFWRQVVAETKAS